MGRAIRATAQNRDAAALSGIDVPLIYAITFGIGAALLGLFGSLLATFIPITPQVGLSFGIRSFIVVVLGGIGSIPGSIVGGIVIGVFEAVASQFVPATSAAILSLGLFVLILLVRPQRPDGEGVMRRLDLSPRGDARGVRPGLAGWVLIAIAALVALRCRS